MKRPSARKSSLAARSPRRPTEQNRRRPRLEALEQRHLMAHDVFAGLGAVGDDLTDEYSPNGLTYAKNWVELLAVNRSLDAGSYASHSGIRGTGYEYNWAVKGANSLDALNQGQYSQLLEQVIDISRPISHSVLMIGMNDFTNVPNFHSQTQQPYNSIYSGAWDDAAVVNYTNSIATVITSMLGSMASQRSHLLVATIPDPGDLAAFRDNPAYSDPAKRQRVTNAVNAVNNQIVATANQYRVPVVDLHGLSKAFFGSHQSPLETKVVGGVTFNHSQGVDGVNMFVASANGELRPHTIFQTAIANTVLAGFNLGYGEEIPLFSEQEMVQLAGKSFGGANTLNLNWNNFVTLPDTAVFLDFGSLGEGNDSLKARLNEKAASLGLEEFTNAEVQQIQSAVDTKVRAALTTVAPNVTVISGASPVGIRYHRVAYGIPSGQLSSEAWPRNAVVGSFPQDWRNTDDYGEGFLFASDLSLPGIQGLGRPAQLNYIANALGFYSVQGVGLMFGLDHADAFGYRSVTPATYANTNGVQFSDFMSGDPALGFDPGVFQSATNFSFSPLAQAKLKFAFGVQDNQLAAISEIAGAHGTIATAQGVGLQGATAAIRSANVADGNIAAGQKDVYSFTAQAGELITLQTLASLVHQTASVNFDTQLKLMSADGTVLATSDDIVLGANTFGPAGTTTVDSDSLILNYVATTTGTYYVEVSARDNAAGKYDLFLAVDSGNSTPWRNSVNHLDVNGDGHVTGIDALQVINEINARIYGNATTGQLPAPTGGNPPPYLDVNGDGYAVGLDALIVINYLNSSSNFAPGNLAAGEGEAADESGATLAALRTLLANTRLGADNASLEVAAEPPSAVTAATVDWVINLLAGSDDEDDEDKESPDSEGDSTEHYDPLG